MAVIDSLIKIDISQTATPVATTTTTIPLLFSDEAPNWDDGLAAHTYGSLSEVLDDGFEADSAVAAYVTAMLSQGTAPSKFYVAKKAGSALTVDDLEAATAIASDFYAAILVKGTDAEIETAAPWFEAHRKMLFVASASESIGVASDETSVAATLHAKNYRRTSLTFSPGSADKGIEAAWVGGQIPLTPGSNNWAYKTLKGIAADALSSGQIAACIGSPVDETFGNGANVYVSQSGRGVTLTGQTSSLDFVDNIVGEDWLYFNLQADLLSVLASQRKVPLTNKGVGLLEATVTGVLLRGIDNGLIDPVAGYSVSAADVSTLSSADRAARRSPTINFQCTLQGAVNAVVVRGTVTL